MAEGPSLYHGYSTYEREGFFVRAKMPYDSVTRVDVCHVTIKDCLKTVKLLAGLSYLVLSSCKKGGTHGRYFVGEQ